MAAAPPRPAARAPTALPGMRPPRLRPRCRRARRLRTFRWRRSTRAPISRAISRLADMEQLLHDLPLDQVTTSMTINATAPLLLAFYVAVADARGVARARLGGTVQNDVLKEYVARGTYIYPPEPSLRLITDVFAFTASEVPQWNSISVSGYHMREAGATAAQ